MSYADTFLASALKDGSKAVAVIGDNGFLFDITGKEEVVRECDITDHYVEENFAVQDNISFRPTMVNLKGYMGEVKQIYSGSGINLLTNIESLGSLGGLAPNFAQQSAQIYSKVAGIAGKISNIASQASNLFGMFGLSGPKKSAAQDAYEFFVLAMAFRVLCTVQTPFAKHTNMAIVRVSSVQGEDSKTITDFTVTFKEIRKVKTITNNEPKVAAGRAADMTQPKTAIGNVTGAVATVSALAGRI